MPEIGTLRQVHQGTIRIMGVSSGTLHPARLLTAVIHWDGEPYTGEYEVTPKTTTQYLYTRNKTMSNDVTVFEIPYAQVSNEQGGYTAIIGE